MGDRLILAACLLTAVCLHVDGTAFSDETAAARSSAEPGRISARGGQGIFFEHRQIGPPPSFRPTITNVQIVDFDRDGKQDVIACDAQLNSVFLYSRLPDGTWREQLLGDGLIAPAHATAVDLDQDGDTDVLVSVMGNLLPDDNVIGSLVLLENTGGTFEKKLIKDDLRRVVDAQPADFDGDGDLDLAVAIFGHVRGQVLWLENRGDGSFRDHELLWAAGSIHVPVDDYDGDGDPDIAAIVSQDDEEVWGFENLGGGEFTPRRLWMTVNFDIGSAGLVKSDLDSDGDTDLLLPVGDNLEDSHGVPQPYHGCLWLENKGGWEFQAHRVATFPGTYAAAAGDLDADGDEDVVLCSMVNDWASGAPSIVWLENDGEQNFSQHAIASDPIKLITLDCGDLDADGRLDIVAGGLRLYPPFDRVGRISSWLTRTSPAADIESAVPDNTASTAAPPALDGPPLPDLQWVDSIIRSDLLDLHRKLAERMSLGQDTAAEWTSLGQTYYAFGFFDEAVACFETAVDRNPGSVLGRYTLGVGLQRLGRIPEAVSEFQRALAASQSGKTSLIWHELGRCYLRMEDPDRAEHAFTQAGEFYASLFQLARLRIKHGRSADALPALNSLTRLHPLAIELHLLKSKAAAALGMADAAQQFRDRAEYNAHRFPLEPVLGAGVEQGNKYGSFELGVEARALVNAAKWDEAATLLREVTESTDKIEPAIMLAGVEVERGNPDAAIEILERLNAERAADPRALLILGDAYLKAGRPDEAIALWNDLAAFRPANASLHAKLAEHSTATGDTVAARRQRALAMEARGIQTLRMGKPVEAIPPLRTALSLDPALPRAWFYLGECLRIMGEADNARNAYTQAIQHDPSHGRAIAMLETLNRE